jgi:hypothetical protein
VNFITNFLVDPSIKVKSRKTSKTIKTNVKTLRESIMNNRLQRILITLGPIIGVLLLIYLVNAAVGTYSSGVEELKVERRAEATATAQAGSAVTETTTISGTPAISGTTAVSATTPVTGAAPIADTEDITAILPPSVTQSISLTVALTGTEAITDGASITSTQEVTSAETVTP